MSFGMTFKHGLKRAARNVSRARAAGNGRALCSRILTYHSVGSRDHEMNVSIRDFRAQMAWLAAHAEVCTLEQAAEGRGGIAITFDDGYLDNLVNAAPILADYGFPATVFVVAGRTGMRLEHDSKEQEHSQLMDWDEVRTLEAMGWTVGGHTVTHQRLALLSAREQRSEIDGCKHLLEDALGHGIETFAYPFGSALDFNLTSRVIAREAGYNLAVSNRYGAVQPGADRYDLRRIWIDRTDTLKSFTEKVDGSMDGLAWMDSPVGIRARRVLNDLLRTG